MRLPDIAMVFAAGLGTRMRPITDTIPKPLVSVGGCALIDRTLDGLAEAGVRTAIVNVHHLADQVEAHLKGRKRPQIVISDERSKLLDQGGGIKKALPIIGEAPFFVCNTDAFWADAQKANMETLAEAFDPQEMDVALLLAPTEMSVGVDWEGDFDLDASGRITRPDGPKPFVYTGVGIVKPQLFANQSEEVFKLAPFFFDAAARGRLFGVVSTGLWLHVGTVEAITEAEVAVMVRTP